MAHPKRRHSHARTHKRRTHQKLTAPFMIECTQCHKLKPAHIVCPACGYYAGREVVHVEFKPKKKKGA